MSCAMPVLLSQGGDASFNSTLRLKSHQVGCEILLIILFCSNGLLWDRHIHRKSLDTNRVVASRFGSILVYGLLLYQLEGRPNFGLLNFRVIKQCRRYSGGLFAAFLLYYLVMDQLGFVRDQLVDYTKLIR